MIDPPNAATWRGLEVLVVSPTPTHPQDHGNRKRIYEICLALKRRGAKVHFVHYPAEHDWRERWPLKYENAMRAEWDSYHLVPPGVPLHADSLAADHTIDEWADPGLLHYIAWVCRRRAFDVMIVNYTWMSFCLGAAPDDVFKILDTHDVFAGRRELLEAHDIKPEFFHTTKAEEAKAVARAHLVWAIKPSEQAYFEKELGVAHCLTMLHAEPDQNWWSKPPSRDGWLRVGTIGARNSVNFTNLEAFLLEALPIFWRYWAPVKIVIAGGCSADFATIDHPNVEVLGRVEDVADFYRSVDVVIAPMQFSTGLKIKVSEALSSGAPLVAHAHASEGYPTRERLHRLPSFASMAIELATLSFERSPLTALAAKSRAVGAEARALVDTTFEDTRQHFLAFGADTLLLIVPTEAFDPQSLLADHFREAIDYFRFTGKIAIFLVGPALKGLKFDVLEGYGLGRRQFVDPELMKNMGDAAPESFAPISLQELSATRGFRRAYMMTDLAHARAGTAGLHEVYVRQDAIRLAGGDPEALVEALRLKSQVVVVDGLRARAPNWRDQPGVKASVTVPFRRKGPFERFIKRVRPGAKPTFLLLLAHAGDLVGQAVLALARRLDRTAIRLDPNDPGSANVVLGRLAPRQADPLADFADLRLVVDLTGPNDPAMILGEAALRLGIPRLCLLRGAVAQAHLAYPDPMRPASVGALLKRIAEAALDPAAERAMREIAANQCATLYTADAGWTLLWAMLTKPRPKGAAGAAKTHRDAAEALWG